MLCSRCHKKEATIYYKQNLNGEIKEYALCSDCAGEVNTAFEPTNIFGSLFSMPKTYKSERKRCTLCGSTFDEIRQRGKVGCAECYSVFASELYPSIQNIHGRTKHPSDRVKKKPDELTLLKEELKAAIEKEEYEKAAELRDRIKVKEAESNEA